MITAAVITVSDSSAVGAREDKSGPALVEHIKSLNWTVASTHVVPDDPGSITSLVLKLVAEAGLIVLTGGTGLAPRDRTPESIRSIAEREVPGFGELMRAEGRKATKFADLSRSAAFTLKQCLILALPGSPKGAVDSFKAVELLIPHAMDLLQGHTEHKIETKG